MDNHHSAHQSTDGTWCCRKHMKPDGNRMAYYDATGLKCVIVWNPNAMAKIMTGHENPYELDGHATRDAAERWAVRLLQERALHEATGCNRYPHDGPCCAIPKGATK